MVTTAMKTCALTHWLTLDWISEERVLAGGAAFDSQQSKGWFNKIRIGLSTAHTHTRMRVCVCVFTALISLFHTALSLRHRSSSPGGLQSLIGAADGRLRGNRTLSVSIYSDFTLHPSITALPSSHSRCSCFPFFASSCRWFHEDELCCCVSPSEMWQNDLQE